MRSGPGSLAYLYARLHQDPGIRGRQFEHVCKWLLEHEPRYSAKLKRVWLWKDWPGRWGADAGIDLVAQTFDGALWAIQAKAYAASSSITKADVDTFLSESSRSQFAFRLLIATTNMLAPNARRVIEAQEKRVGRQLLADLERAEVSWPRTPSALKAPPPKILTPRRHQRRALAAIVTGFRSTDRGQAVMACGTGKTLVGLWAMESMKAARTLVLVPSLSLLAQTLREWTAQRSQPFEYLPVCSDETVSDTNDLFTSHTSELGLPATTTAGEVAAFMRRPGRRVVFATYQSSSVVADAQRQARVPEFDLALADEAHRCAGPVDSNFARILDERQIGARRRLFMTATPRRFAEHVKRRAAEDYPIVDMDDVSKFGPVFHRLTFGDAIEQDLLSDYQVWIVGVDHDTYRDYVNRGRILKVEGRKLTDARSLASHIALAKAMRKQGLRRVITFHGRVKRAQEFSAEFPEVVAWMPRAQRPSGSLWSKHVAGYMPSGERDVLLQKLRHLDDGERGLLANARCLAEGVDVPTLDGVAFIDPKRSQVDIIQAVGRAIRKAPDKTVGSIILPVFISSPENPKKALDDSAFEPVWKVLQALRTHDEDALGAELDHIRTEMGKLGKGAARRPGKIHFDLPASVAADFASAFEVRLVERTTANWEMWFGLLENFVEKESHARVPQQHVSKGGFQLGAWVNTQRLNEDRISLERRERLEGLRGWTWDPFKEDWENGFRRLQEFVEQVGYAKVPAQHVTPDGFRLGGWVSAQRTNKEKLAPERQSRLESLPSWSWSPHVDAWKDGLEHLLVFVENEGHARVPTHYVAPDGFKLSAWVIHQRSNKDRLSRARRRRLERLPGWAWDANDARWEEGYLHLEQFAKKEGHAGVLRGYRSGSGFDLGSWVETQRMMKGRGHLSPTRQRRLESIRGWTWDVLESAWENGYRHMQQFVRKEGHANVPSGYVAQDGFKLGGWVLNQRSRKARLSPARMRRLEGLPGWTWDTLKSAWDEGFRHLQQFVKKEGHAKVPVGHRTAGGFKLGQWVQVKRLFGNQGRLSSQRRTQLEKLPGWTWDPHADAWEEGFRHLQQFVKKEGHARVPRDHRSRDCYKLGEWVKVQVQRIRQDRLAPDRRRRLEKLKGWVGLEGRRTD